MSGARRWLLAAGPVLAAVGIGGFGARNAAQTYGELRKPAWAPPASVFGPVWSGLYATIGVAGWRIFGRGSRRTQALQIGQLALNAAWPVAFFARGDKRAALAIILALDGVLAAELIGLWDDDRAAALLLAPYAAWSGFATALNAAVGEPD